jgi:hypothetical protein
MSQHPENKCLEKRKLNKQTKKILWSVTQIMLQYSAVPKKVA